MPDGYGFRREKPMRKVKLITGRVLSDGQRQKWGDIIDVPDDEAARLIACRQALPIESPKPAAAFNATAKHRR